MSNARRKALRDFYRLPPLEERQDESSRSSSSHPEDSSADTAETDLSQFTEFSNTEFDAEAYVKKIAETASPKELFDTERSLSSAIRQLSGDHKSLVYNHYTHLLRASRAIEQGPRPFKQLCSEVSDLLPEDKDPGSSGSVSVKEKESSQSL
ncbi:GARP complex subunit Vps51 [Schizosaccharomyces japonicus yFS275]|uniref:GARP complex subunit Vps51 n=1 Tax=Schizosaccharomyces japonicus (strain yFS275 / FY16936) TaxID=402676 RepID=B6JYI4_SCHJY|nr:GARP complex subunit Vps51 [Schizosaccharomyces japonicus yFS275]EEB06602.1 GARP complex subunit Vps51 [Schizosaccharomyces japonicus yFS275]